MDFKGKPTVSHDSDWDGCGSESRADPKEGEVSDNSDSDDRARKSGSSSCDSSSESKEEYYSGNTKGDDNDQACLYSSPGVLSSLQSIVESPQTYSVLPHEDWPEWLTNFSTPAYETEFFDCNTENASSSTEYDNLRRTGDSNELTFELLSPGMQLVHIDSVLPHEDELGLLPIDFSALSNETFFIDCVSNTQYGSTEYDYLRITGDEKELILVPPAPGIVAFNIVDTSQLGQVDSVLPHEDWPEWPTNFSTPANETEFFDCNTENASSSTEYDNLRRTGDSNELTFELLSPGMQLVHIDSVFPHEDEPGLWPIDFSALSNETEFAAYASSSTDNYRRRTGDDIFFEPPAPEMQSIVDVLQLGQGSASTVDSNEILPDLPNELLTFNYVEQPTDESASTVERKNFFTTRNDREAAIDLNRKMYHACMTLIRVLEDSLRANSEKQMQLIGSIEYLKSSGSKVTKGKKVLPNATKINTELKLPSMDPPNSTVCKTPKKSRGRPRRGANLCILDRRLMELLGSYKVIRQGRNMVTLYPGDVRRLAIIIAATIILLRITDLPMPEDMSGFPKLYWETSRMAIELSRNGLHPGSPVEPFPPNIVLLTGLRGLLVESTRVEPCSSDIEKIGDSATDMELLNIFQCLFGGFSKPFVESFNLNGWKTPTETPAADPKAASADGVDYPDDESLFNTNADVQPSGIGSCVGGGAGCSFGGGEEEGHIDGDGSTGHTPKRGIRIRTPVKHMFSPTTGERDWSDEDKQKLVSHFEKFGFNGEFESLSKTLNVKNPKSANSIRYLVEKFLEERHEEEWEVKINTLIDQLRNTYPQSLFVVNFELALKLKSFYGSFPDPSKVGGISYRDCYGFLASLMGGHVPKGISLLTKQKLFNVFSAFVQQVMSEETSFPPVSLSKKERTDFEKGKVLAERRSKLWTAEESRARELIESGDLERIMAFYSSHAVLNPL